MLLYVKPLSRVFLVGQGAGGGECFITGPIEVVEEGAKVVGVQGWSFL